MTKFDKIIISIGIFFIYTLIFTAIVKSIVAALFIAMLLSIMTYQVSVHLHNRFHNKKIISLAEMEKLFAIMGNAQNAYFIKATPSYFEPISLDCGFYISLNCSPVAIFPNYKFSPCSLDDIAKFYRITKDSEISSVWVLSKQNARSTILFAKGLDVDFNFIPTKRVHKFLANQNFLPPSLPTKKVKLKKADYKEVFNNIITKKRAKYFLFSGFTLGILAFFTPIKAYYIVVSIICIILGILCLFAGKN